MQAVAWSISALEEISQKVANTTVIDFKDPCHEDGDSYGSEMLSGSQLKV